MAAAASSDFDLIFTLLVDDLHSSSLISDENFAEELQLQEAIDSSSLTSITKSESTVCIICTDSKSAPEMFTTGACSHSFCSDCISKHIAAKLEDTMAVKCPDPKCAAALEPDMCGSFVPKEVMERWGDALFDAMILKMKRFYCPFEDCGATMIDDGGEEVVTAAECSSCRRVFCAQCKVGWHGEMECDEFEKLRKKEGGGNRDDVMTMKLADEKKWKRCSNCRIYVEKMEGCIHITCRCGSEFCYSCGSTWSDIHECN